MAASTYIYICVGVGGELGGELGREPGRELVSVCEIG